MWTTGGRLVSDNRHLATDQQPLSTTWRCSIAEWLLTGLSGDARYGLGANTLLSHPSHCQTDCSRIRRWIVQKFQILIVSAVRICKQCLQTIHSRGFAVGPHCSADRLGYNPSPTENYLPPVTGCVDTTSVVVRSSSVVRDKHLETSVRQVTDHWWPAPGGVLSTDRQTRLADTPTARPPVVQPVANWSPTKITSKFFLEGRQWLLVHGRQLFFGRS